MARVSSEQWTEARARREAGESITDVAKWLGVDRALVSRRAKAESWSNGEDVEETIRRKVTEKVTGIVTACDPKKKAEALDAAASRRADVEIRHQIEWEEHKSLVDQAIAAQDFDAAKLAKITAETLKIRQEGERKAWRLDTTAIPQQQTSSVIIGEVGKTEVNEFLAKFKGRPIREDQATSGDGMQS